MSETPTTQDVRIAVFKQTGDDSAFYRWLAAHDAEITERLAAAQAVIAAIQDFAKRAREGSVGGEGRHHAGYWEALGYVADELDDALSQSPADTLEAGIA